MTYFRPCPKDPPVVDRLLIECLRANVWMCEWPECTETRGLQVAHIRARGMGGGRRKDVPDNLMMMCPLHHDRYDHRMGQSRANQERLREHLRRRRPEWVWALLVARNAKEA